MTTVENDDRPQRAGHQYIDTGLGRDPDRHEFRRFIEGIRQELAASDEPPVIVVSELSRLYRNRQDRAVVDELMAAGVDVMCAREEIFTDRPGGPERYRLAADLLMLAYEGEPLAASDRVELVERYVEQVLDPWLDLHGATAEQRNEPLADVQRRLHALAGRWGTPELTTLLAPFREIAENHEPAELPIDIRALAVVAVRNSDLETLHLADIIDQADWRVITQAAAYVLSKIGELPAGAPSTSGRDPFAGVLEDHLAAAAAFAALDELELGESIEYSAPEVATRDLDLPIAAVPITEEGYDVLDAMDERVSLPNFNSLEEITSQPGGYLVVPSFKHISRNPHKLFAVVEYVLARGCSVATANSVISAGVATRRDEIASYNDLDLSWCGLGPLSDVLKARGKPGRNDPCPCGSGRKYKRCCGQ